MEFIIAIMILAGLGIVYEQLSRRKVRKKTIPGQLIDMGGRRLHVTDCGEGGPPVVIVHGAGDSSYSWTHVINELSKSNRVITFDRPGMGSSDVGPEPTPEHTVKEIHDLLEKLGVTGPIVLVGHSLGGLISRLYAMDYPDKVVGLVFLDSTHEFLIDDAKFKQGFAALGVMLKILRALSPFGVPRFLGNVVGILPMFGSEKSYYRQQISPPEFQHWKEMVYQIFAGRMAGVEFKMASAHIEVAASRLKNSKTKPQFGDLPIAVVNNPGFGENWTEMQKELASRSTNHFLKISDRKGHSLQMPRPEYVLEAVHHVVNQTQFNNKVI